MFCFSVSKGQFTWAIFAAILGAIFLADVTAILKRPCEQHGILIIKEAVLVTICTRRHFENNTAHAQWFLYELNLIVNIES